MFDQIQSEVIFHEVIDSTNVEAKRLIENDKINKATWIIANRQTSGKGRNNNKWVSELGNFYGSYVLPINLDHRKIPFISCITSLSVYDAIKNFLPNNALLKIKWPNDILYDDANLAGILIENLIGESASLSIIGVGINLKNSLIDQNDHTNMTSISFDYLYNSAGLWADKIAHKFNLGKEYLLIPFKGNYWDIKKNSKIKIETNLGILLILI